MRNGSPESANGDGLLALRVGLPDWPRLMPLSLACAYFGVCPNTFRRLDIEPRRIGRRVLWDRRDLDRYVDQMTGEPLDPRDDALAAKDVERRFLARYLKDEDQRRRWR
jgi:hypothetical protein